MAPSEDPVASPICRRARRIPTVGAADTARISRARGRRAAGAFSRIDPVARARPGAPRLRGDVRPARGFVKALPFQLTNAQRLAAWRILQDIARPQPMNRLLEGDVGSGKTVVAAMTMHHVARAGFQSVLLAPTEVLARQHADVIQSLLGPFQIDVGLLVGSTPAAARKPMLASLAAGALPVLIGTHALIEEGVQFKNLALTVVDEQHRFGVGQR
ncbi:MAG: DEAD/DEAH box helicase, partial [Chloroflexi bacterium]